jgi:heme/copper-type cytochrome/quinol oxidase subunit 2
MNTKAIVAVIVIIVIIVIGLMAFAMKHRNKPPETK